MGHQAPIHMEILYGLGCYKRMNLHSIPRKYYIIGGILTILLIPLIVARIYLGVWLLEYVNRTLNNIEGYKASVESINIDLYRGAYRINHIKIRKKVGNIPTPFIDIDTADLSIQWTALFHGRIVSSLDLIKPTLNFAVNKSGTAAQTGANVDWTKPIKDLAPIDINHVTFEQGKLTYQDFSATPKVDIYIHNMSGELFNLRNVVDKAQPLPSKITLKGDSIGGGALRIGGKMNILKPVPDMDIAAQLENVNLRALNDYSNAYAAIDIRQGNLSVYSEIAVKNNHVSGYVKPIATNIALIDLRKSANPVKVVWESVVSVVIEIFTNHNKEQFATKIPLEGNLDDINTDTWSAIGGIIHNAFVSALKKGVDGAIKSNIVSGPK